MALKSLFCFENRMLARGVEMVAKRIFWAVCVALAAPSLAHALGLGDIRLSSALNQPLDAEIDLLNATPEELAGLQANLASRET